MTRYTLISTTRKKHLVWQTALIEIAEDLIYSISIETNIVPPDKVLALGWLLKFDSETC